jgi:hypothetical protein
MANNDSEKKTVPARTRPESKKKGNKVSTALAGGVSTAVLVVAMAAMLFIPGSQSAPTTIDFGSYGSRNIVYENVEGNPLYAAFFDVYKQVMEKSQTIDGKPTAQDLFEIRMGFEARYRSYVMQVAFLEEAGRVGAFVTNEYLGKKLSEQILNMEASRAAELIAGSRDQYASQLFGTSFFIKPSEAENAFVSSFAKKQRVIEFVAFTSAQYPDAEVKAFGESNPDVFKRVKVSRFSAKTKELADSKLADVNSGKIAFADAVRGFSSDPSTQASGGVLGGISCVFQVQEVLGSKDIADAVLALSPGQRTGVFESATTPGTYDFYQLDEAPSAADFNDAEILKIVRSYILGNEASRVETWLTERAKAFKEKADLDFDAAVLEFGLEKKETGKFASAVGNLSVTIESPGYGSFPMAMMPLLNDQTDQFSYQSYAEELAGAKEDRKFIKACFTVPVGGISEPHTLFAAYRNGPGNVIVFRVKEEITLEDSELPMVGNLFERMVGNLISEELNDLLLSNSAFRDNFDGGFKALLASLGLN